MTDVRLLIPQTAGRADVTPRPDGFLDMRLAGETMGTNWSARWFSAPGVSEEQIGSSLERIFAATSKSMSSWQPDSLICRYNRLEQGQCIEIGANFSEVMTMALDVARRSNGAFDPCLGEEVRRRGFGSSVAAANFETNIFGPTAWDQIFISSSGLFQPGGVALELSAIAKGYAVDLMAKTFERFGIAQFIVEIGGEFVARGVRADGMPWWVNLENPYPEGIPWRIALVGQALATSGDYRQFRTEDGKTMSHIVPASGRVCDGGDLASVSVLHEKCALADAWATALFAAGDRAGLRLADSQGLAVLFQYRNAPPRLSASMQKLAD